MISKFIFKIAENFQTWGRSWICKSIKRIKHLITTTQNPSKEFKRELSFPNFVQTIIDDFKDRVII